MNEIHEIFSREGSFVIGYNIVGFDNKILYYAFKKIGKEMPKLQCFDCQMEFKAKITGLKKHEWENKASFYRRVNGHMVKGAKFKLVDAVNHYNIPKVDAFHGAKADVDYTHEVYLRQREEIMNARNK